MNIKEGSIVFLTRRRGKWFNPRVILSNIIANLSKTEGQDLDDVIVHTAIIYNHRNELYVRDMDYDGNSPIKLEDYLKIYKDRIHIKENPFNLYNAKDFNDKCLSDLVEYDFFNLLFFQLIKAAAGVFIGGTTIKHRICSEDVARMFNILKEYFNNPEQITPAEIDRLTNKWKVIWIG